MSRKERSDVEDGDGGGDSGDGDAVMLSSGRVTGTKRKLLSAGWISYVGIQPSGMSISIRYVKSSETELVSSAQIKLTDSKFHFAT